MKKLLIMGTRVDNVTMTEVVNNCDNKIQNSEKYIIYTPNTEFIMMANKDKEFQNLLNKSDLNIPDGVGLILGSKIKKHPLKEKVAGFDLTLNLIKLSSEKGYKIYFVGGKPGVAQKASDNLLKEYPKLNIVGVSDGYFKGTHLNMPGHEEELRLIEDINLKEPDIVFIGFGAVKQERWIDYNKDKVNAKIFIGNGGSVDVLAGDVKRAPKIFIKLGLEWFYRLITDPKRIKRQMLLPAFLFKIIFSGKNTVKELE